MKHLVYIDDYFDYLVSDEGEIFSEKYGRFKKLKAMKDKNGYLRVGLYKDGKQKYMSVHRLVANAFIENPDNKDCIDHINGIRDDSRAQNLRWCTKKENNGFPLARVNKSEAHKGKSKVEGSGSPPKRCAQIDPDTGRIIAEYVSAHEAARLTGFRLSGISLCCNGKYKTSGNYKWAYID